MPNSQLARGWEWKKLGEVGALFSGTAAPQEPKFFQGGRYPFVRVQDLSRYGRTRNLVDTKDKVNDLAVGHLSLKLATKGTILFPKSGAAIHTNSRAILGVDAYIVSHLAAVKPSDGVVLSDWLFYWLCQVDMQQYSENEAYPSLKLSRIAEIPIAVPPLAEQRRIVARLEDLLARIDSARALGEAARAEFETLSQAVLAKAFRGEL